MQLIRNYIRLRTKLTKYYNGTMPIFSFLFTKLVAYISSTKHFNTMKSNHLMGKTMFFLSLFLCFNSSAQSNDWQLMNTENGIEVYSRIVSCETEGFKIPLENIVFKAVNTTSASTSVNLEFEIYFEEGCNGCEKSDETSSKFQLNAGESKESTCSNENELNSFTIRNANFDGSWKYTHSIVKIQSAN